MKTITPRMKLDWSKLLAFSQVKTSPNGERANELKKPGMTMFGAKQGVKIG
jgi:hypothetical protein